MSYNRSQLSLSRHRFTTIFGRLDHTSLFLIALLICISHLAISSASSSYYDGGAAFMRSHMRITVIGVIAYFSFASFDYRRLRPFVPLIALFTILLLVGVLFTSPIQNVRRWYRVPFVPFAFQPSELAKFTVILGVSWLYDMFSHIKTSFQLAFITIVLVSVFSLLIYKQPDLGTALVLFPLMLGVMYFGGAHKWIIRTGFTLFAACCLFVTALFTGIIEHEKIEPYALSVLKEYQYERLKPGSYHQKASQTAISLGGILGSGWKESRFSSEGWLPFGYTDSVYCVICEEFGLFGGVIVICAYFGLMYFAFKTAACASDTFGALIASGVALYIPIHLFINIGMMAGLLPITGVPLVLLSFGGSSYTTTLILLGILQNIHVRRFAR